MKNCNVMKVEKKFDIKQLPEKLKLTNYSNEKHDIDSLYASFGRPT